MLNENLQVRSKMKWIDMRFLRFYFLLILSLFRNPFLDAYKSSHNIQKAYQKLKQESCANSVIDVSNKTLTLIAKDLHSVDLDGILKKNVNTKIIDNLIFSSCISHEKKYFLLNNFVFHRDYKIKYITINHNNDMADNFKMRQLLEKNGYKIVLQSITHDLYKLPEVYFAQGILHIGANDGIEMDFYNSLMLNKVIWVEAIPKVFDALQQHIARVTPCKTEHIGINALVTDADGQSHTFHLFDNNYGSSSIFEGNNEIFWNFVHEIGTITLTSKKLSTALKQNNIKQNDFDYVVIDTQGSELLVLKGFEHYLEKVKWIEVEVSQRPFYHGGVLFPELNNYLNKKGFFLAPYENVPDHGNVVYERKNF